MERECTAHGMWAMAELAAKAAASFIADSNVTDHYEDADVGAPSFFFLLNRVGPDRNR